MMALADVAVGFVPGGKLAKKGVDAGTQGLTKLDSLRTVRSAVSCVVETGANSFTLDTLALMADGQTRPIGELHLGDWIWSTDPVTGDAGPDQVVRAIDGEGARPLVSIVLQHGQTLIATGPREFA